MIKCGQRWPERAYVCVCVDIFVWYVICKPFTRHSWSNMYKL